jgi:serine protease Do
MRFRFTFFSAFSIVVILLGASVMIPFTAQSADGILELNQSFVDLSQRVSPTVVRILITGFEPGRTGPGGGEIRKTLSGGSGVIVDSRGYIITNAHVVAGASRIQVVLPIASAEGSPGRSVLKSEGKIVGAQMVGLDTETDLAVLKIQRTDLPFLEMGDSDLLRSGEIVLAFGSPFGLENSVTMGIISAVARQVKDDDPMVYIQTDAPINPGNSGGPLVNAKGELVGINSFIMSQSGGNEGLGFAAPSNIVEYVFNQLKEFGTVSRGEIGVHAQTITPTMAEAMNLSRNWGVIVGDVTPGMPSVESGLEVGDIILTLNGKVIENARQFDVNLYGRAVGEKVELEILRGGEQRTLQVSVVVRPDDPDRLARLAVSKHNLIPQFGIMGLEIDSEIRRLLGPTRKKKGVVVAALSSNAAQWGDHLRPGDIIYSLNGQSVDDLRELKSTVGRLSAGSPVVLQIERQGRLQYLVFDLQ